MRAMRILLVFTFLFIWISGSLAQEQDRLLVGSVPVMFEELSQYQSAVAKSFQKPLAIVNLLTLDKQQELALSIALANQEFLKFSKVSAENGINLTRNEIFAVRKARLGDTSESPGSCANGRCYTVEMFNFTLNLTSYAVINLETKSAIEVRHVRDLQTEVPGYLEKLAIGIALNTAEVVKQLGAGSGVSDFIMAGTKTSLNRTRCERSRHLCVAPTFIKGQRALWTIVDVTDGRVVGTRWTGWGDSPVQAITEQRLRDDVIMNNLCEHPARISRDGWEFDYGLTSSDGLQIQSAKFHGEEVIASAKNVDWHVSYSDLDGFGYSDAVGCPIFSAAAVVPAELPKIVELWSAAKRTGFELHQDFLSKLWPLPCNYYYEQRYQFYRDGSFRPAVASVGRGCGESAVYRPVIRIRLAIKHARVYFWNSNAWTELKVEGWKLQEPKTEYSPEGYQFKIVDSSGRGYYLEPSRGQFQDGGKGDNAYVYFTRHHGSPDEGELDLPTIGPCCNSDFAQGPERFINTPPETVAGGELVIWYVPQLKNSGQKGREYCWATSEIVEGKLIKREFPCIAGPKFIPFLEVSEDS